MVVVVLDEVVVLGVEPPDRDGIVEVVVVVGTSP
jgi:hypothetical protein